MTAAPNLTKRSIRTTYHGVQYRSKLEADYARVFDALALPFEYETHGAYFGDVFYHPDFWLPRSQQYVEVKGVFEPADVRKIQALVSHVAPRPFTHPGRCPDVTLIAAMPEGKFFGWLRRAKPTTDWSRFLTRDAVTVELLQCGRCAGWWFADPEYSWRCQCCGAYDGNRFVADTIASSFPGFPDVSCLRRTTHLGGDHPCLLSS